MKVKSVAMILAVTITLVSCGGGTTKASGNEAEAGNAEKSYSELSSEYSQVEKRYADLSSKYSHLENVLASEIARKTTSATTEATTQATTAKATTTAATTVKATTAPTVLKTEDYVDADYKTFARNPDEHEFELIKISGKIIQVLESDGFNSYRIAQNDDYDKVWMITYIPIAGESRILEDDYVTAYGGYMGLYSYESTMGTTVTVPNIYAEKIVLE